LETHVECLVAGFVVIDDDRSLSSFCAVTSAFATGLPARVIFVFSVIVNTRFATFFVFGSTTATASSRTSRAPPFGCAYLSVLSATTVPLCVTSWADSVARPATMAAAANVTAKRRIVFMSGLYRATRRCSLDRGRTQH
jgi:hypothetical protein